MPGFLFQSFVRKARYAAIVALTTLIPLLPSATPAQTFWTAGTANWNTASNWTLGVPNAVGGTTFDAVIDNGGTAQLTGAPAGSVRRLRVGRIGGAGNLIVDAATLNVTENLHLNETSNGTASVIVRNGATVSSPSTIVGYSSASNTSFLISGPGTTYNATTQFVVGNTGAGTPSLIVENGATLASAAGFVGNNGVATIRNTNSRWTTTGDLTIGNVGTGTLNIESGATVHIGTNLNIYSGSKLNLNGGTVRFAGITTGIGADDRINFNSGTLQLAGNHYFPFDTAISIFNDSYPYDFSSGKAVTIEGTATIEDSAFVAPQSITGGTFSANSIVVGNESINVNGSLPILSGTVHANNLSISGNGTVILSGGTLRFDTYNRSGTLTFTGGTIKLAGNRAIGTDAPIQDIFGESPTISPGKTLAVEGTATLSQNSQVNLAGGTLSAPTMLMSPGSRLVTSAASLAQGAVLGLTGSVIDATGGNLTIGDGTKVNGFYHNGTIQVGQRTVTLADANDAVLDSAALVTLGSGSSPGIVNSINGLTLDFGGNITGFGTINTPNNAARPLINNGHIAGNSASQKITLPGYVKGVGTFDNVTVTGTFSPGLSPSIVTGTNLTLSPTSTLVMEIGGSVPGSDYDQLNIAGDLTLGGTLVVSLINNFQPTAGQTFDLFDGGSLTGSFSSIQVPTIEGFTWNTSQLASGMLSIAANLPGDYNQNGAVDAADYTRWRDNLGSPTSLPNDDSAGVGADDYTRWKSNFGQAAGSGGITAAVPEPTTAVFTAIAVWLCAIQRARKIRSSAKLA